MGAQWLGADVLTKKEGGAEPESSTEEPSTSAVTFKAGDKVMGNWKNQGKWYPYTIKFKVEKKHLIFYDDGDK